MNYFMDQNTVHFTTQGEGPPVVLIHGIGSSGYGWSSLSPTLVKHGYQVYVPDLPGHGESYKPERAEHYHIQTIYSTFEKWIESLNLNQKYWLIGHSLGGHLSLRHSLRHPDHLNGMVLIDPFYSPQQLYPFLRWLQRRAAIGTALLSRTSEPMLNRTMGWNPELGNQLANQYRRQMAIDLHRASPMILHILPSVPDLTSQLSEIHTPTQVIWGSRDRTLLAASFPKLVARLPNATGCEVVGGSHQPHLSQAETVASLVLKFLKGILP